MSEVAFRGQLFAALQRRADRPLGHQHGHRLHVEGDADEGSHGGRHHLPVQSLRFPGILDFPALFLVGAEDFMMRRMVGLISVLPSGRGVPTESKLPTVTMLA